MLFLDISQFFNIYLYIEGAFLRNTKKVFSYLCTVKIPYTKKNTGIHMDTYTLSYSQCVVYTGFVRVKHSFGFLFVSDSWYGFYACTCNWHLRQTIVILDGIHKGVYSNTIIVIYTLILYKYCTVSKICVPPSSTLTCMPFRYITVHTHTHDMHRNFCYIF